MIQPDKPIRIGGDVIRIADFLRWDDKNTTLNLPMRSKRYAGQARALAQIDIVVRSIARSSNSPFRNKQFVDGSKRKVPTKLGERIRNVLPLIGYFDGLHDYGETIAAFLGAVWLVERKYQLPAAKISSLPRTHHEACVRAIEEIVSSIRVAARQSWYMRCKSDREYRYKRRRDELEKYTRDVLALKLRTLVVRVDLSYLKWARKMLTIDDVYADLSVLRSKIKCGKKFANLIGYAVCIEQGRGMGYHVHAAFFFDGNAHRHGSWKGIEIRSLWGSITEGRGHCHVCNLTDYGIHDGIGMVKRDDPLKIQKCVNAMLYLAKPHDGEHKRPSFLLMRPHDARTYWTGVISAAAPASEEVAA